MELVAYERGQLSTPPPRRAFCIVQQQGLLGVIEAVCELEVRAGISVFCSAQERRRCKWEVRVGAWRQAKRERVAFLRKLKKGGCRSVVAAHVCQYVHVRERCRPYDHEQKILAVSGCAPSVRASLRGGRGPRLCMAAQGALTAYRYRWKSARNGSGAQAAGCSRGHTLASLLPAVCSLCSPSLMPSW